MSDDEVKKEIKEDHINIKVKDMVRVSRGARAADAWMRANEIMMMMMLRTNLVFDRDRALTTST